MCVCHLLHFSFLFIFPLFGYSFLSLMALRLFNPGGGWVAHRHPCRAAETVCVPPAAGAPLNLFNAKFMQYPGAVHLQN